MPRSVNKARSLGHTGTHAHYAGEFEALGAKNQTSTLAKSPEYRAARAEHFARSAQAAAVAHGSATGASRAAHALVVEHAHQMAAKHARAAAKIAPGSEHDVRAAAAHEVTKLARSSLVKEPPITSTETRTAAARASTKSAFAKTKIASDSPSVKTQEAAAAAHRAAAKTNTGDEKTVALHERQAGHHQNRADAIRQESDVTFVPQRTIAKKSSTTLDAQMMSTDYANKWRVFTSSLNETQRSVVRDYTNRGFEKINNALRRDTANSHTDRSIQILDKLMKSNQLQTPTTVYQGADSLTTVHRAVSGLGRAHYENLKIGDSFTDRAYLSTTVNKKYVEHPTEEVIMHIALRNGVGALPVSNSEKHPEQEILLERGLKLKVVDRSEIHGVTKSGRSRIILHMIVE